MKKLTQLALGILATLAIACEKKGSDPAPAAPPPPAQYNYVNNQCYDTTTNQPAAANLCAHVLINGAYRWNGVTCIDQNNQPVGQNLCNIGVGSSNYRWNGVSCTDANNQPVAITLCQNQGWNGQFQIVNGNCISTVTGQWVHSQYCAGLPGYNSAQCNGYYIKYNGWYYYTKYCQGKSCSGQTLIEYGTQRQVTCP